MKQATAPPVAEIPLYRVIPPIATGVAERDTVVTDSDQTHQLTKISQKKPWGREG